MELTSEIVGRYVGGQFEFQNAEENYFYRGEISGIEYSGGELLIRFAWLAKMDPPFSLPWKNDPDRTEYKATIQFEDLEFYSVSDIGSGRIALSCAYTGELGVLYLPSESGLDPAKVEGLVLPRS